MTELRDKVIDAIVETCDNQPRACLERAADRILALPEIAEALQRHIPSDIRANMYGQPCRFVVRGNQGFWEPTSPGTLPGSSEALDHKPEA